METEIEVEVRSSHIDFLGHMNNAKYVEFMEWGRIDWYDKIGTGLEKLLDESIAVVVVSIDIDFKKEVKLRELLRVKTIPVKLNNTSFVFRQKIYDESNDLVAEADVTNVMLDRNKNKSIKPVKEVKEQFI